MYGNLWICIALHQNVKAILRVGFVLEMLVAVGLNSWLVRRNRKQYGKKGLVNRSQNLFSEIMRKYICIQYNLCRWLWRIWGVCFCKSLKRQRKFTEFMWFIHLYSLLLSGVMKPCSNVQYTHTQFTDNNTLQPEIVQFQQAPVRMLQPCRCVENSYSIALSWISLCMESTMHRMSSKNFFCQNWYLEYYGSPLLPHPK